MKHCPVCFVDIEKQSHQIWCPRRPKKTTDLIEVFDEIFPGFKGFPDLRDIDEKPDEK